MRRPLPGWWLHLAAVAAVMAATLLPPRAGSSAPGASPIAPPAPARRKPPTDKYLPQAIEPFVEAVLADKAGDLDTAVRRYQDSNKLSEQANTHYNIADLRRRMERWKQAIEGYKKYVELAPDAPDRAEVERLIAQLEQRPGQIVIDGEDPDGVVFVDGKLIGPSPAVLQVGDGRHVADRVTPAGFVHRTFDVKPATAEHLRMTATREEPGNVVLSGNTRFSGSWHDNGNEYRYPGRNDLPPGRHRTYLVSRDRACAPLVFDVPRTGELVYVWIDAGESERGCVPIKIRQTTVRLAP